MVKFLEEQFDYHCYPSRGSRGIDLVCLSTMPNLPHLGIEVGGASKSCKEAFGKMALVPHPPGMYLLVVREIKVKGRNHLRWHAQPEVDGHDLFELALAEARSL